MSGEEFKAAVLRLVNPEETKLWLTRVHGHRLDFICSVGSEQLKPVETLLREGDYILLGQDVSPDALEPLSGLFDDFVSKQAPSEIIPLF